MTTYSVDKLSMDILDDNFVKIFQPIHIVQYLLGTLQVKIQYGFTTSPSYGYDVFSVFVWIIHIVSLFIFTVYCESSNDSMLTDFYLKLGHILNGLIIAMVTIRNFCKSTSGSHLYVKLQKIDRDLNMKTSRKRNKHTSILSTVFATAVVVFIAIWSIVLNLYVIKDSCPVAFIIQLSILGNYMDIILIFFQMYFVVIRLEYMNSILKEKINKLTCVAEGTMETYFVLNETYNADDKLWNRFAIALRDIVSVLDDLINYHQFTIFGLTCEFIILDMLLIQSIVTTIKQQIPINTLSIINVIPVVMLLLFISLLSITVELLKSKMGDSRKLCTTILRFSNDTTRDKMKRILLLLDVKKKIYIYDIYSLDAQLPLNLFAITATYTIVLLQFALLL
nr:gustatory receptor 42 [Papilio glaucus]